MKKYIYIVIADSAFTLALRNQVLFHYKPQRKVKQLKVSFEAPGVNLFHFERVRRPCRN